MNKTLTMAVVGFGLLVSVVSCNKPKSTQLNVNLSATVTNYDAIEIQVQEVWIKTDEDNSGWLRLPNYDKPLSFFKTGSLKDTILASGGVAPGEIRMVKFVFGDNNKVVKDNKTYALQFPTKQDAKLVVINLKKSLSGEHDALNLLFDIEASVSSPSAGVYVFNPKIKLQ
jgi:hypothetical protein